MVLLENCRLCQDRSANIKLDNNETLIYTIYHCVGIKIEITEDTALWPRNICEQCNALLELFKQFRIYSLWVDQNLRNEIKHSSKSEDVINEIIYLQFEEDDSVQTPNIQFQASDNESENCSSCNSLLNKLKECHNKLCNNKKINIKSNVKIIPLIIKSDKDNSLKPLIPELIIDTEETTDNFNKRIQKKNTERKCPHCKEVFKNKQLLVSHMKSHSGSFVCQIKDCKRICKSEYALKYHMWKHKNSNNNLLCKICGKSFQFASYLKQHEQRHTGIKEFKCTECGKEFFRKAELDTHTRSHHEGIRFFCSICPRSFMTHMNLQRHELVHKGIKQFVCEECSHQFYTEKELVRHRKRNHQGIKPHVCEYCAKSFFEKTQYRVHLRCHTGERPFTCNNSGCSKSYYEKSHLKAHKRTCDQKNPQDRCLNKEQLLFIVNDSEIDMKDLDVTTEYVC